MDVILMELVCVANIMIEHLSYKRKEGSHNLQEVVKDYIPSNHVREYFDMSYLKIVRTPNINKLVDSKIVGEDWRHYVHFVVRTPNCKCYFSPWLDFPDTQEGRGKMKKALEEIRSAPPQQLGKWHVFALEDYQKREKVIFKENQRSALTLPVSNVLLFRLEKEGKVIIRPSGTEPKIKIYASLKDVPPAEVDILIHDVEAFLFPK